MLECRTSTFATLFAKVESGIHPGVLDQTRLYSIKMAEMLLRKRVACAAFRLAQAAVRDCLLQLRREHRHVVVKNPINAAWVADNLDMGERSVRRWWNTDLLAGNFHDDRKGKCGQKRKLSGDDCPQGTCVAILEKSAKSRGQL